MNMLRAMGLIGVLLGLVGCGSAPTTIVQQPITARPQPVPAEAHTNGSIFQMAAYHPLFEDRRPRNVGDTLTINISEKTQASKQASSNGSMTGAVDSAISLVGGLPLKWLQGLVAIADSSNEFDDITEVNSSNNFSGNITVTVIEVLPNRGVPLQLPSSYRLRRGCSRSRRWD